MKIVVFACDAYVDIAPAFLYRWRECWPDCPHEIVFVSNSPDKMLHVLCTVYYIKGKELAFGWRLRKFVRRHYGDEHLLLMMADYLVKSIDIDTVMKAHELCSMPGIRHVRLRPMPHPQHIYPVEGFGKIEKNARYSLSLQPGIWETQVLFNLCLDSEDPWQTEVEGSGRVKRIPGDFLSTETHAISHINYYRKGEPQGLNWVKENVSEELWPKAIK